MSELHKRRVLALIALVCGAAIVLPLVFGFPRGIAGQAGDGWRNFIYDFQTLIGGGAAIIAAWYTVRQMRISDDRSELRHQELVSLQMRSDRLRVERLLNPSLSDLEERCDAIRSVNVSTLKGMIISEPRSIMFVLNELMRDCEDVIRITSRVAFANASELIDGDLTYAIERLGLAFSRMGSQAERCQELAATMARVQKDSVGIDIDEIYEDLTAKLNLFRNTQTEGLRILEKVCDGLAQMRKEYKIHF